MFKHHEKGQSLVEVVIALMVTGIVISALAVATTVSIRNAQFSQDQTQATRLAEDGLEKIRAIRDRNNGVTYTYGTTTTTTFSDLWNVQIDAASNGPAYCSLQTATLTLNCNQISTALDTSIGNNMSRQIMIDDAASSYNLEKKITVRVLWSDAQGTHESHLETVLTKQ